MLPSAACLESQACKRCKQDGQNLGGRSPHARSSMGISVFSSTLTANRRECKSYSCCLFSLSFLPSEDLWLVLLAGRRSGQNEAPESGHTAAQARPRWACPEETTWRALSFSREDLGPACLGPVWTSGQTGHRQFQPSHGGGAVSLTWGWTILPPPSLPVR